MKKKAGKQGSISNAMLSYEWVDGEIRARQTPPEFGKIFPWDEQDMIARELCRRLNTKLHHNGSWRVVLLEVDEEVYDRQAGMFRRWAPTLVEMQFYDHDGDCIFKIDCPDIGRRLDIMVEVGISRYVSDCEEAYQRVYKHVLPALDLRPDQMYSPAKGEKSVDPTIAPPSDFVSL